MMRTFPRIYSTSGFNQVCGREKRGIPWEEESFNPLYSTGSGKTKLSRSDSNGVAKLKMHLDASRKKRPDISI